MKKAIIGLNVFLGIGAVFGGLLGMLNTQGGIMGLDVEMLNNFFPSFFAPGLLLFVLIGLTNLFALVLVMLDSEMIYYYSILLGFILVLWIVIQCLILQDIVALHVILLVIGIVQIGLGFIATRKN